MYVVFYGKDRGRVRDAVTAYINEQAPPNTTLATVEANGFELGQVANALGANSLFGGEQWYLLDTPSAEEGFEAEVLDSLAAVAASPNHFVILEGPLLAAKKKQYAKHATNVTECEHTPAVSFNNFSLAEALADKDRRKLWVLLQAAKQSGQPAEAIIGILWWQLKAMRLAAVTTSAVEANMKEYPYGKAKRALSKFRPGEVEELATSLLVLYHEGHAGMRDIDLALEQWVLGG